MNIMQCIKLFNDNKFRKPYVQSCVVKDNWYLTLWYVSNSEDGFHYDFTLRFCNDKWEDLYLDYMEDIDNWRSLILDLAEAYNINVEEYKY